MLQLPCEIDFGFVIISTYVSTMHDVFIHVSTCVVQTIEHKTCTICAKNLQH